MSSTSQERRAHQLPELPPSVIAHILSYNVHNLVDVARLRELNKAFGPQAVSLIPSLAPSSGHFLPTTDGNPDFFRYLVSPDDAIRELGWNSHDTRAARVYLMKLWNHYQDKPIREGVAIVDDVVSPALETQLMNAIQDLAQKQVQDRMVDYHPHSNDIVRDLVHPALYSFISGVSRVEELSPLEPCDVGAAGQGAEGASQEQRDFWGRMYEDSKYQWLPTTFSINHDGDCAILDYINNLTPREAYLDLYDCLAKLFEQCLPFIESVYAYIGSIRPHLRTNSEDLDYNASPLPTTRDNKYVSFRGQELQVITKIVDYELQPGQSHEGVWHVEGMSHGEIVMTCLYILDRDESIQGGNLEFKRAFLKDEATYIFDTVDQVRPYAVDDFIQEGLKPLGTMETLKGRLIVFPNSHVHRVTEMINTGSVLARRRIVVFFVVNPLRRIISTREVVPQQVHSTAADDGAAAKKVRQGAMTLEEAKKHRLELMKERKHHKQDWNVREIELCEH